MLSRRHEGDLALVGVFGVFWLQEVPECVGSSVGSLHLRDLKLSLPDVNQGWTAQGFSREDLMRADEEKDFRK